MWWTLYENDEDVNDVDDDNDDNDGDDTDVMILLIKVVMVNKWDQKINRQPNNKADDWKKRIKTVNTIWNWRKFETFLFVHFKLLIVKCLI